MAAYFGGLAWVASLALAPAVWAAPIEAPEWDLVAREACGSDPSAHCLQELRKVCHEHATFRCYYSRKARLDAIRQVGFPVERLHHGDEY